MHTDKIEKLFLEHEKFSYNLLNRKIGYKGREFIEDVYCDARLKALKHINSYDETQNFKRWWSIILVNALRDKINKEKQELPMEQIEEKHYSIDDSIYVRLTLSEVIGMLPELSTNQRKIVTSIIERETGNTQDAVNLNQSERLTLHKARKKIAHMLKK